MAHKTVCVEGLRVGNEMRFRCAFCGFTADTEMGADVHVRHTHKRERAKKLMEQRGSDNP